MFSCRHTPWSLSEAPDEAPVRSQPCLSRPQLYRWPVLRKDKQKDADSHTGKIGFQSETV